MRQKAYLPAESLEKVDLGLSPGVIAIPFTGRRLGTLLTVRYMEFLEGPWILHISHDLMLLLVLAPLLGMCDLSQRKFLWGMSPIIRGN